MIPAILAALEGAGGAAAGAAGAAGASSAAAGASGMVGQLTGSIQALKGGMGDLLKPFGAVKFATGKLYEGLNALPDKIGEVQQMIVSTAQNWVKALAAPVETVKQLGDAVSGFVRLSNPALVKQFEYRIENALSTIGHILEPVMEALTASAQKVGDVMARLRPALQPAIQGVVKLIDLFTTRFADLAELAAPAIHAASILFSGLVEAFITIQKPITWLIRQFNALRESIFRFVGISTGFDKNAQSDIAVRPARMIGTEDLQREMAKNALEASIGGDKPQTTESWLEKIHSFITQNLSREVLIQILKTAKEQVPTTGTAVGGELWRVVS